MNPQEIWEILKENNFTFFTGVPDSTFKSWMSFLDDMHGKDLQNIIASNECEALSIASGYHLATKNYGTVYMQNSGLGKTVNPITSLADPEVYSIPMLLLIGWRGEPGKKDEPQHKKMGRITIPLLDTLEIPHEIFPANKTDFESLIPKIKQHFEEKNSPFALIVKKGTLEPYKSIKKSNLNFEMNREQALNIIVDNLKNDEVIVSTTGKTSRELFEARMRRKEDPRDFYTVGSMGCASAIGLGIALNSKAKTIIFDGDGALIMQMGSLATISHYQPSNLYHILFDNNAHDSTGGQPTVSNTVNFKEVFLGNGYKAVYESSTEQDLKIKLNTLLSNSGPSVLIVKVNKGARENLGRPTTSPIENKKTFMKRIEDLNKVNN